MYKLYSDTEKELFYETDYKPLPKLYTLSFTELIELCENLENACDNAYCNHADMLCSALYDDIVIVKRYAMSSIINSYSSGTIAGFIGNTKYIQIDRAVNKTLYYIFNCEDEDIYNISVDAETIKNIIVECFLDKRKPEM